MTKRLAINDQLREQMTEHHDSTIGNSGSVVQGVQCPCCGKRVIYNGNYFCEDWGYTHKLPVRVSNIRGFEYQRIGGDCDWALGDLDFEHEDRKICIQLGINYD